MQVLIVVWSDTAWPRLSILDIAVIFRVHECYDILSVQCEIFDYHMLFSKIYDLKASYQEPEFSFTDLFNLKTPAA